MFKVKVVEEVNLVLGVLSGELVAEDLNAYANEVVRTIEKKLLPGFTYMLDLTKFKGSWHDNDIEIDEKMSEINHFLSMMGLGKTYIIGAGRKVYDAYKGKENADKIVFFSNLAEAFEFLERNRDSEKK